MFYKSTESTFGMNNKLSIIETSISGAVIIQSAVYVDNRGSFCELFNKSLLRAVGIEFDVIQENLVVCNKGALRGMHFQKQYPQAKLVKVLRGSIFDVIVDLRKDSKTYKESFSFVLTENDNMQLYIPKGLAHGCLALEDGTVFSYLTDESYHPEDESGILWNDPEFGIEWPIGDYVRENEVCMLDETQIIINERDMSWKR